MLLTKAHEWSADELVWKYKYLEKHLNRPLHLVGMPSIENMVSAIDYELRMLNPERGRLTRNLMNNAWRQHKKRSIDHSQDRKQRTFTMDEADYFKLGEIARSKKSNMNKIISTLIRAEYARLEKKKNRNKDNDHENAWGAQMGDQFQPYTKKP